MKTIAIVGVYMWGALYAAGVFTAGMIWGDRVAVWCILGSAAAAYLSQFLTTLALDEGIPLDSKLLCYRSALFAMAVSIIAGAVAGTLLVLGG